MMPQGLSDRLWRFAARIAKVVDALPDTRVGRHVAGQIVRSGIAAAPNYDEARSGESRADFAHKINIALKELVETCGWLKFIVLARLLRPGESSCCWMNASSFAAFWESPLRPPKPPENRSHGRPAKNQCQIFNDQFSIKKSEILMDYFANRIYPKK